MARLRVLCVAAARPNFMKIKPVIDALEAAGHQTCLVHTGQHYDLNMSDIFFEELGLRSPDCHLGVGSGTYAEMMGRVMIQFESLVHKQRPDMTVVVGDVTSTLACALVSAQTGIHVAHVEAGLRSRDWAMPEEINRVATDRVSDLLLAPSPDAVQNLEAEGYRHDQIHLVGNVMIDSLLANLPRARQRRVADRLGLDGRYGLVTLHRPSNVDDVRQLGALMGALADVNGDLPLVFPVHPRTRAQLDKLDLADLPRLIEPLGYLDFLSLMSGAAVVMTDSGGIQEETTALGIPCLTLRDSTERPITVAEGTNRLAGTDPETIVGLVRSTLIDPPEPRCPALWDGKAALRIAEVLSRGLPTKRPTDLP